MGPSQHREFASQKVLPMVNSRVSRFPESKTGNLLNTVNSDCQVPKRAFAKFSRGKNSGKDGVEEDNENEDVSQEIDLSLLQDDGNDVKIIKSRLNSLRLDTLL